MLVKRAFSSSRVAPQARPVVTRPVSLRVNALAQPSHKTSVEKQRDGAQSAALFAGALVAPYLHSMLEAVPALATGGEFGILEGRSAALIHPLVMGALFVSSGYAGWLGWQWRRTRTIGDEVKALKAQVPKVAVPAGGEGALEPAPSPLTQQIESLEKERKELIKGGYRDKHFWWGSILLGSGVLIGVEGAVNTWFRTGKLFPGPHLFAGAGIVVLWALAASLVPQMQKGNDGARNAHIALNAINMALFAWQVPTGLEIVGKVFEFTKWP